MKYFGRVNVMLKEELLDPQGQATLKALHQMNYLFVKDVRIGKHIILIIDAESDEDAYKKVNEICQKLLHNYVIEDYSFTISKAENKL